MKYIKKLTFLQYSDGQSFLNFLRILNRLEVGVLDRAVKLESPCTYPCKLCTHIFSCYPVQY
jgi:hypothetical protein